MKKQILIVSSIIALLSFGTKATASQANSSAELSGEIGYSAGVIASTPFLVSAHFVQHGPAALAIPVWLIATSAESVGNISHGVGRGVRELGDQIWTLLDSPHDRPAPQHDRGLPPTGATSGKKPLPNPNQALQN
jgi:hypothetical protein